MASDFPTDVASMDDVTATVTSLMNATVNGTADAASLLLNNLGSRYRSTAETSILTVFYCAIFITGVIGNVSTCIVIIRNGYMHTATNYYLFSLAVSDLLTLILGLPPELYTIFEAYPWRFGEPYCQFKSFITEMTSTASVMTITAFTVERYVAICHPIRAQTMSNLSRAVKIIFILWVMAAICTLPLPIYTKTWYYVTEPYTIEDSLICNIPREWMDEMEYYFQFSTFILFILPMTVITWLYILIGLTLRRSGLRRQCSEVSGSPPQSSSRRAVLKMLVAVVVAFFICWAPYHAQRLMTVYVDDWTATLLEIQSVLFYSSGILYFVSSTVNPILYNLMSKKYRQAFKHTMCRCCLSRANATRMRGPHGQYLSDRSQTYVTVAGTTRVVSDSTTYGKKSPVFSSQASNNSRIDDKSDNCWRNGCGLFRNKKDKGKTSSRAGSHALNGSACPGNTSRYSAPAPSVSVAHQGDELELQGENPVVLRGTPKDSAKVSDSDIGTLL